MPQSIDSLLPAPTLQSHSSCSLPPLLCCPCPQHPARRPHSLTQFSVLTLQRHSRSAGFSGCMRYCPLKSLLASTFCV